MMIINILEYQPGATDVIVIMTMYPQQDMTVLIGRIQENPFHWTRPNKPDFAEFHPLSKVTHTLFRKS